MRAQREHDRRNDGVCIFRDAEAERQARARVAELRDLARRDRLAGTWPAHDIEGGLS